MCATLTEDEIGTRVETATGESIGVVTAIEGSRARVEPNPGLVDSIKSVLGWGNDDAVAVHEDAIAEVTPETITLAEDVRRKSRSGDEPTKTERDSTGIDPGTTSTGDETSETDRGIATDDSEHGIATEEPATGAETGTEHEAGDRGRTANAAERYSGTKRGPVDEHVRHRAEARRDAMATDPSEREDPSESSARDSDETVDFLGGVDDGGSAAETVDTTAVTPGSSESTDEDSGEASDRASDGASDRDSERGGRTAAGRGKSATRDESDSEPESSRSPIGEPIPGESDDETPDEDDAP